MGKKQYVHKRNFQAIRKFVNTKNFQTAKVFGVFIGLCFLVVLVMIPATYLTESVWQRKLRQEVYNVLEENSPEHWSVGDYIPLNTSLSQSAACFEIISKNKEINYAVIIRAQTLYGPFPVVFTYSNTDGAKFAGFSSLHGRVANILINSNKTDSKILYWQNKIPAILKKTLAKNT